MDLLIYRKMAMFNDSEAFLLDVSVTHPPIYCSVALPLSRGKMRGEEGEGDNTR